VHSLVWLFTKNLSVGPSRAKKKKKEMGMEMGTEEEEDPGPGPVWNPAHNGWWSAL